MLMHSFYEFFAGGGMARAGLGTNWLCLFANDFDEKKADAYKANWGEHGLLVEDVAKLSTFDLPEVADLVWASFPCQDLSLAGNGAGLKGTRSGSFWPFWKLIQSLKAERRLPKVIVLENVCGLLTSRDGADFQALCQAVSNGGYRFGAFVADAALFTPQSRPRLFMVAVREDIVVAEVGKPSSIWHTPRLIDGFNRLSEPLKMRWNWYTLPVPPSRNMSLCDILEPDSLVDNWHSVEATQTMLSMMNPSNRKKLSEAMLLEKRVVGAAFKRTRVERGAKFQRVEVRFDGIAGCLRTPGGGSSRQIVFVVENGRVRSRLLTARETARLMGLADEYVLPKRYNDACHLTGDGVAVPVVRFLADQLLEPILDSARLLKRAA